jgi:suppressor of G2 allele of SKP1
VLAETVVPEKSTFSLGKVKTELKLAKAKEGSWKALERASEPDGCCNASLKYPTSARKPVDGAGVARDLAEEPEPEPTGEAAVNALFKQIYANASEDTKRAMMKSFVESNGTVLSTNWEEVGGKTINPVPPKT